MLRVAGAGSGRRFVWSKGTLQCECWRMMGLRGRWSGSALQAKRVMIAKPSTPVSFFGASLTLPLLAVLLSNLAQKWDKSSASSGVTEARRGRRLMPRLHQAALLGLLLCGSARAVRLQRGPAVGAGSLVATLESLEWRSNTTRRRMSAAWRVQRLRQSRKEVRRSRAGGIWTESVRRARN